MRLDWMLASFWGMLTLTLQGQPNSFTTKLPTARSWLAYDSIGIPVQVSTSKLLYILGEPLEVLGIQSVNKIVQTKLEKAYPYAFEILSREAYLQQYGPTPPEQHFGYQLQVGFDGQRYAILVRNLQTGTIYLPGKRYISHGKNIDAFIAAAQAQALPRADEYPAGFRNYCSSVPLACGAKSGWTYCSSFDYFGFPPDLNKQGLCYIQVEPLNKVYTTKLNRIFAKSFPKDYPFAYQVLTEASARERYPDGDLASSYRYQLRLTSVSHFAVIPVGTIGIYYGDIEHYLMIIEDLQTGERYCPALGNFITLNLRPFFFKALRQAFDY